MAESTRPEFLKLLQSVPVLGSLRDTPYGTMPDIVINCWREDLQDFETITWNVAYPFYTLDDLKLDIYLQRGSAPEWLPSQVFIGTLASAENDPDDKFAPVCSIWKEIDSVIGKRGEHLHLRNPLTLSDAAEQADERFVDRSGAERTLELLQRGRMTLETAYLMPGKGAMPEFYAFCVSDLLQRFGVPPDRPVPAYEWNGRFRPFFPSLRADAYAPTDAENTAVRIAYKRSVRQLLRGIEEQLESTEPTVASKMQVSAVYALRLLLGNGGPAGFPGCEDLFFRVAVDPKRPFMRIMPADGGPITKIHVKGIVPVPDILDPHLIPQWAQEISPTPGADYLFLKVLTKGLTAGSLPIYTTVRVFADGSADATVLPSKQQRFLNPAADLRDLDLAITAGLKETYLGEAQPTIGEATVEIGLQLPRQSTPITRQRLLARLGVFSYFFQEAPAFETPAPILLLKYKAIDQFTSEQRIFSYVAQYEARRIINGGKMPMPLLESVMQEFAVDRDYAFAALARWQDEKSKFVPIQPEINTFSEENAGGIDVGIYGQHPFYFVRIYRCNSEISLRRIYTLLSLMLTLDLDFTGVASPAGIASPDLAAAATAAAEEEEQKEEAAAVATAAAAAAPTVATTIRELEESEEAELEEREAAAMKPSRIVGLVNSDEEEAPRPAATAAKSRLLMNSNDEEEQAPRPAAKSRFLVNSDDEGEEAPPKPVATAAKSRLLVNSDDEEEEAPPKPAAKPALTAKSRLLVNENDEEEAAPPPPLPTKAQPKMLALMADEEDADEAALGPKAATAVAAAAPSLPTVQPAAITVKRTMTAAPQPQQPLTVKRAAVPQPQQELEASGQDWPAPLRGWFIKQLNRLDPKLFTFTPKHGDQNAYSRKCQASSGQQPMVLSQAEYDRMREEYQKDEEEGRIVFIEFPLKGDEPDPPASKSVERITVMKYGTDSANQNYYFCPKLFCLLDRIMILEEDFEGDKWRNPDKKGDKETDTCPFCGGKKIDEQLKYVAGYTVAERKDKPKTNQKQTYIDFINPTTHPDNFQLPCCYIPPRENKPGDFLAKSKRMHIDNEAFAHLRGAPPVAADEEDEEEALSDEGEIGESYTTALAAFPRRYILNATFHPLERGKFGICPPNLDAYFNQKSDLLVSRTAIKQLMKPGAKGFFRMGVDGASRNHPDNFFGALAPYMGKNSVDEVRMAFVEKLRDPNIFLSVNFGNLVHEFYRPAQEQYRPQNVNELEQDFIKLVQVANYNPATSKPEMVRLYMAHNLFMEYLTSRSTVKEYRIFAPILAYPGLITSRGLILILLDYDSSDFTKPVSVKCPPLGYQPNLYDGADFGFMLRDTQGIYESLVYIEHFQTATAERGRHNSYTSFQVSQLPAVAPVISERRQEFMGRCRAPNYNLYTGQSLTNSRSMLTFSQLVSQTFLASVHPNEAALYPYSVVRDSYNHIVGATFKYDYRGSTVLIPLPLADHDGYIPLGHPIHFDWSSVADELLPTVPAIIQFYERFLGPVIEGPCPGYRPVAAIRSGKRIRAVRLENGLNIPAKGTDSPLPIEDAGFIPEWQINREIAFSLPTDHADESESVEIMKSKSLEELYQHFRLSVAGWLNSELPAEFTKNLETNIIFKNLPFFEKRKRLQIELEDTLREWFAPEDDFALDKDIFYRRDCRKIQDAGQCTDACGWIGGAGGRCGIHIPTNTTLGSTTVNTADLFIRRVIDELIIFPEKRRQLLANTVKKTGNITIAIQIGDQYIIPDSSPRWQELLSLVWTIEKTDIFKSLEDSKGIPPADNEAPCLQFDRSIPYTVQRIRRRPAAAAAPAEEAAAQPVAVPIPPIVATPAPLVTIRRRPAAAAAATAAPPTIRRLAPSVAAASAAPPTIRRLATAAPRTMMAVPEEAPSPLESASAAGNTIEIVAAPPTIRRAAAPTIRRAVSFAASPPPSVPEEVAAARPPTIRRALATKKPQVPPPEPE